MKTIDLTTLQGWNDLPDGTYSVTVGAKAVGYTRIIQSQAVSVVKESPVLTNPYLTFSSPNSFTLTPMKHRTYDFEDPETGEIDTAEEDISNISNWDGTIEYSTDTITWNTWNTETLSAISDGTNYNLYLRGTGNTIITGDIDTEIGEDLYEILQFYFQFTGTNISCEGNIETLLDYATVQNGQHPAMGYACYEMLFAGNDALISAPELPATTLADFCYAVMFQDCALLTTAPSLPATTLALSCYASMFWGCISLTTAPSLPATTLAYYCYGNMFRGCTSLTTAPTLSATTLAQWCYRNMFYGCTSLYVSDTQTLDAQYEWRIPTSGVIIGTGDYEQSDMFTNCLGTRASNNLAGEVGQQYIYYTQNEPVGSN